MNLKNGTLKIILYGNINHNHNPFLRSIYLTTKHQRICWLFVGFWLKYPLPFAKQVYTSKYLILKPTGLY